MPIYEYRCANCGHDFETLVRFSDPAVDSPQCPGCQSVNTQKRLSTIAAYSAGKNTSATTASCSSSGPFR